MGFIDKLKNIFFEEEEDEEIEDTRPPKKEKEVIAKKVEIPKRNIKKDNVEITPGEIKKSEVKEVVEIASNKEPAKEAPKKENSKITELIFEDEDFILDLPKEEPKPKVEAPVYKTREQYKELKREEVKPYVEAKKESYEYKKKEEKPVKTFTPSPIISPIYGILDKNYKKEEVKERKEVRLSSRPGKMDLDSVRNKAFGDLESELFDTKEDTKKEKESETKTETKKVKNVPSDKPVIDKVTLGEADEYFNDLGLAYNTDYKDISKEINDGKIHDKKNTKEDKLEDNLFDLIESMYDKED